MSNRIVELEQEALKLQNNNELEKAIMLYETIVKEQPNYEFGMCFYQLACCLEDVGRLEEAEKNYIKALEYGPEDVIRVGGYASFLYLHGDPQKAFDVYLNLYSLEKKSGGKMDDLILALNKLGSKMGLTKEEIRMKISQL